MRVGRGASCQEGSAALVMVAVVAVAGLLVSATGALGAVAVARARADTAADAAALAAADMLALGRGADAAHKAAKETASSNGARLIECRCSGRIVDVTTTVPVRLPGGVVRTATARARAEVRPTMSDLHGT